MVQLHFTKLLKHVYKIATKRPYQEYYFQLKCLQERSAILLNTIGLVIV